MQSCEYFLYILTVAFVHFFDLILFSSHLFSAWNQQQQRFIRSTSTELCLPSKGWQGSNGVIILPTWSFFIIFYDICWSTFQLASLGSFQVYIDTQGAQLRTWKIYPKTTDDQFRHDGKADGQRSCWQFTLWKALSFWILWGSMLVKPATFLGRGWENQQSIFQKVSRNGSEGSNAELLGDLKTWRLFFALWTASLVYLRHTYS